MKYRQRNLRRRGTFSIIVKDVNFVPPIVATLRKGRTDFLSSEKDCTEQGLPKKFVITTKRALESFVKVKILQVLERSTAHSSGQVTTTLLKTLAMIKGSAQIPTIHNLALYILLLIINRRKP